MTKVKNIWNNFKKYQFLMSQLITRDFKVKYKRSVLGVVWSLLYPVLMMTVMAMVFSQMFRFSVEGINYLVYLMTGIIMFQYFSEATNNAMTSVVGNFGLINKVYIPKYIFPVAKCIFVGINFVLTLIPWIILIILTQFGLGTYPATINWYYLLIPYIFFCFFLFTVGIGLLISCISVFLRDMFYIYGIVLTILTYFTPIMYDINILDSWIQRILKLNPLYHYITFARTIILYDQIPSVKSFVICGVSAVAVLIIGIVIFKKNQDKFIYYM